LTCSQAEGVLIELIQKCDWMEWAVAWATPNRVVDVAHGSASKFRRLLLGTHFFQTDPAVLERFSHLKQARMMLPQGATFHPKVYKFQVGSSIHAVIGSHNLTGAAFNRNAEVSVHLSGQREDSAFTELNTFLDEEWARAKSIQNSLHAYRVQYEANRQHRVALEDFIEDIRKPLPHRNNPAPFTISWEEFVLGVQNDEHHDLNSRLRVLSEAAGIFASRGSMANMDPMERKGIAGTFQENEVRPNDVPWALFGSTQAQGVFKNLVNQPSLMLSQALDHIPLSGMVSEANYQAFLEDFRRAFEGKNRQGGVPAASRLLAMKRPDRFVCVNSPNERGVCRAFGVPHTTLDLDNYWDRIAVPITLTPWWQHPAPHAGMERAIWDGRAALLDSIYYEPGKKPTAQ